MTLLNRPVAFLSAFLCLLGQASLFAAPAADFFVAPNGQDSAAGDLPAPG